MLLGLSAIEQGGLSDDSCPRLSADIVSSLNVFSPRGETEAHTLHNSLVDRDSLKISRMGPRREQERLELDVMKEFPKYG